MIRPPSCPENRVRFRGILRCTLTVVGVLAFIWTGELAGQSIRGVVVDAGSRSPVNLASVLVFGASGDSVSAMLTDSTGFFELQAPHEEFVLRVSALGYHSARVGPFRLESADAVQVTEVSLLPQPIAIQGLDVEARLPGLAATGFYDRMAEGRGQFLTPTDIAESDAWFTPEVFHGLKHVVPQYAAAPWERWVTLTLASGQGNCEPRIWIDGVWLRPEFRHPGEGLDGALPLEDLLAAEVYWGSFQAPIRYQGTTKDNPCGVVLLWTRSGNAGRNR